MNWPKNPYEHQTLARGVLEQSRFSNPAQLNETGRGSNGTLSQDEDSKNGAFQQYGGQKSYSSSVFNPNNHSRDPKSMIGQTPGDDTGDGVPQPFPNSPFQRSPFPMQAFQQQHPMRQQQLQQHLQRQQQQQQLEHQMRQQQFMKQKQMAQQQHMLQQQHSTQQHPTQHPTQQHPKQPQHLSTMQQGSDNKMSFFAPASSFHAGVFNGNIDDDDDGSNNINNIKNNIIHTNNNNANTNKNDENDENDENSRKDKDGEDDDNDDIISTGSKRSDGRMDGRSDGRNEGRIDGIIDGRNEGMSPSGGADNDGGKKIPPGTNEDTFPQGHPGLNPSKFYPPHSSTFPPQQYPPHHNFPYFQHMQQQRMKGDMMGGVRFMRGPSHHTMNSPSFRGTPPDLRAFYSPSSHPSHHTDQPTQHQALHSSSHQNQQPHSIQLPHNNPNQPHNNPPSHLQRILQSNNYPSPNSILGVPRDIKLPLKLTQQPPPQQQPPQASNKGDDGDEDDDSKNTSEDTICYEDEDGVKVEKTSRSKTKNDNRRRDGDDGGDDEDDDDTVDGNTTEDDSDMKRGVGEGSEKHPNTHPTHPSPHTPQPPPYHQQQHPYPVSSMPAPISQNNFNNHSNQPPNNQPNIPPNHPSNYPFNHPSNHPSNHPFNYHPSHLAYPPNHHPFPQKRYYDGEPICPPDSFNPQNYPIRNHPHQFPHDFMPQNYPSHHHRMPPHQSFLPQRPPHHFHHKMNGGGMDGWRRDENISTTLEIKPPSADSFDESSTSDTQMSFPGKSDQHQDDDRPHKKMKFDHSYIPIVNYTDPRQINLNMQRYAKNEAFTRLLEMGGEDERGVFLLDLFSFMEDRSTAITTTPTVSKQPLDLFKLYCIVKQFGGMVEVSKNKRWRDVSAALKMGSSSSAGFVVKKNYGRFMFPFECMRDRGNIDPAPILAYLEQPLKKSSKRNNPEKSILDHPNLDPRVDFHSPRPSDPIRRMPNSAVSQFSQYNGNQQPSFQTSNYPSHSSLDNSVPPQVMHRVIRPHLNSDFEHLRMGLSPHKRGLTAQAQKETSRFPVGCVEAVRPVRRKIKKLNLKVLGQVDSWRVMMALRSGLLSEASWALNLLTALLADNQATSQLKLTNLPGLLGVLICHLKSALKELFVREFKELPSVVDDGGLDGCKVEAKMDYDYYCDFKEGVEVDKCEFSSRKCVDGRENRRMRRKDGCVLKDDRKEEYFTWDDKAWEGGCDGEHVVTHMETRDDGAGVRKKFYGGREAVLKEENGETDNDVGVMSNNEEELRHEGVCSEVEERLEKGGYMRDDLSGGRYSEGVSCVEVERIHGEVFNIRDDCMLQMERRCLQIINIFRSLSFIPGNEHELSKHPGFLFIVGQLLLLGHVHKTSNPNKSAGRVCRTIESCMDENSEAFKSSEGENGVSLELCGLECSWRTLESLREDALVIMANIAGCLELWKHSEEVVLPLLDGLLHWCTCPSTQASDADVARTACYDQPEPGAIQPSFCNLALEAASKLCVVDSNVDLLVVTPPFSRLLLLIKHLCGLINHGAEGDHHFEEEMMVLTSSMSHLPSSNPTQQSFLVSNPDWMSKQVSREFALVLVACLLQANKSFAKVLSLDRNFVSSLFKFIEVQCLRLNLCILTSGSTSSDDQFSAEMLRKAALILLDVANHTDQVASHKQRLLSLIYDKMPPSCDEEQPSTSHVNAPKNTKKNLPSILNEVLLSLHSK